MNGGDDDQKNTRYKKNMYENLPAVFEFARVVKGSPHRVSLTYEEYLEYKDAFETLCIRDRAEYTGDTVTTSTKK